LFPSLFPADETIETVEAAEAVAELDTEAAEAVTELDTEAAEAAAELDNEAAEAVAELDNEAEAAAELDNEAAEAAAEPESECDRAILAAIIKCIPTTIRDAARAHWLAMQHNPKLAEHSLENISRHKQAATVWIRDGKTPPPPGENFVRTGIIVQRTVATKLVDVEIVNTFKKRGPDNRRSGQAPSSVGGYIELEKYCVLAPGSFQTVPTAAKYTLRTLGTTHGQHARPVNRGNNTLAELGLGLGNLGLGLGAAYQYTRNSKLK